jgi:hypothetical protein
MITQNLVNLVLDWRTSLAMAVIVMIPGSCSGSSCSSTRTATSAETN